MSNVTVQRILGYLCCSCLQVPDYWSLASRSRIQKLLRLSQCHETGFVGWISIPINSEEYIYPKNRDEYISQLETAMNEYKVTFVTLLILAISCTNLHLCGVTTERDNDTITSFSFHNPPLDDDHTFSLLWQFHKSVVHFWTVRFFPLILWTLWMLVSESILIFLCSDYLYPPKW